MRGKVCVECDNVNTIQKIGTIITKDGTELKVQICRYCGAGMGAIK